MNVYTSIQEIYHTHRTGISTEYIPLTVLAYLQNKRGSSGQNQRTLHTFSVKVHPPLPAWGPSGQ